MLNLIREVIKCSKGSRVYMLKASYIVQRLNLVLSVKQWSVNSLKTTACLINTAGTNYHFTARNLLQQLL